MDLWGRIMEYGGLNAPVDRFGDIQYKECKGNDRKQYFEVLPEDKLSFVVLVNRGRGRIRSVIVGMGMGNRLPVDLVRMLINGLIGNQHTYKHDQ